MAQLMLGRVVATAVIFGAGVATTAAIMIHKKFKKFRNGKCGLCGLDLNCENSSICVLKCCHKFHDNCMRAYVHSIRHCTMKCPTKNCNEKEVMGAAERRNFELWAPNVKFYCNSCCNMVERDVLQSLPCWHGFCKSCLKAYIGALITMEIPLKCPMEDCPEEIPQPVADIILGGNDC